MTKFLDTHLPAWRIFCRGFLAPVFVASVAFQIGVWLASRLPRPYCCLAHT